MRRLLVIIALLATATAYAGPFKETLSKDDLATIVKAVQAALPPVDAAAQKKCQPIVDEYNKAPEAKSELTLTAARCYRSAGALGAAIMMYGTAYKYPAKGNGADMLRELASAEEAAALYDKAADHEEKYWASYGGSSIPHADAATLLIRATCIRRQLGQEHEANDDFKRLVQSTVSLSAKPKPTYDSATLCDGVRPIAMPAKST